MLKGNDFQQSNGLFVRVDWLSFTILDTTLPNYIISMLGYSFNDFRECPRGLHGYRKQLRHIIYPISIQYDGLEGMFVHVDISGSAIHDVIEHFQKKHSSSTPFGTTAYETTSFTSTVFADLLKEICSRCRITRLDLAVDDMTNSYYTMPELYTIFSSGSYISKFRKWKNYIEYGDENCCAGHTIYFGSRESGVYLRIYDKQLEQNKKLISNGELPIMHPWIRWEIELKQERAEVAANLIIQGRSINEVTIGILSNYLRIIQLDNNRKCRCSTSPKWEAFLDNISKVSLYSASKPKTMEDTKRWLMRQVASSLAAVVVADEGDLSFIQSLVDSGSRRFSMRHINMIESSLALEGCT